MVTSSSLYALGFALIFIGILIIAIAIILLSISGTKKGKVRGGGVIMIGPVPIIFGTDKSSPKTVILLSLALTVMLIIVFAMYYLMFR